MIEEIVQLLSANPPFQMIFEWIDLNQKLLLRLWFGSIGVGLLERHYRV